MVDLLSLTLEEEKQTDSQLYQSALSSTSAGGFGIRRDGGERAFGPVIRQVAAAQRPLKQTGRLHLSDAGGFP